MREPITFMASAPTSAIFLRAHGDGGLRLTLDVPDTEADVIGALYDLRGQTLSVAIVPIPEPEKLTEVDHGTDDTTTEKPERSIARLDKRRS